MKTAVKTLVPSTTFGNSNEVNGAYDGTTPDFSETGQKAVSFYLKDTGIQTIHWYIADFVGSIKIEATLATEVDTTDYFMIDEIVSTTILLTENKAVNLTGNYTWIRATINNFTGGTIKKITMSY